VEHIICRHDPAGSSFGITQIENNRYMPVSTIQEKMTISKLQRISQYYIVHFQAASKDIFKLIDQKELKLSQQSIELNMYKLAK
jgi:hypothetical protein